MYYNHVYFYTCDVLRTCRELWYLLVALVDGKKKESMDCSPLSNYYASSSNNETGLRSNSPSSFSRSLLNRWNLKDWFSVTLSRLPARSWATSNASPQVSMRRLRSCFSRMASMYSERPSGAIWQPRWNVLSGNQRQTPLMQQRIMRPRTVISSPSLLTVLNSFPCLMSWISKSSNSTVSPFNSKFWVKIVFDFKISTVTSSNPLLAASCSISALLAPSNCFINVMS